MTDHIGKPVLMLDSERLVSAAADYEPFGRVNRVESYGATPVPFGRAAPLPLTRRYRVNSHPLS